MRNLNAKVSYPNLRHLRLFCTYLRVGLVSDAAEICGVSQPAATQALARLDQVFEAGLIDRKQRVPAVTPQGKIVLLRAARALEIIQTGCERVHQSRNSVETCKHITISHLRALSAFGEAGNFSASARLLGQSEPAVHRTARDAEAVLKVDIFEGAGRNIRLNPQGLLAVRWARLALNELDSAVEELREESGQFDGRISIGTLPLARTSVIPEATAEILQQYPEAQFEILEGSYSSMLSALEAGRIDLIVGALRDDLFGKKVIQEKLFPYRLSVMAGINHPLAGKSAPNLEDLAKYPWIVAREGTPSREVFTRLSEKTPLRNSVEAGSLIAIRGLLMQTDSLALLSRHQCNFELEAGFLTELDFELESREETIGLTHRQHWMPTALQTKFLSTLREVGGRISG